MQPKPGEIVTCIHPEEAYDSGYGLYFGKTLFFKPGDFGVVFATPPKVTKLKPGVKIPGKDRKDYFATILFRDHHGHSHKAGLDFCNVKVVPPQDTPRDIYVALQLDYICQTITAEEYKRQAKDVKLEPGDIWRAATCKRLKDQWSDIWYEHNKKMQ